MVHNGSFGDFPHFFVVVGEGGVINSSHCGIHNRDIIFTVGLRVYLGVFVQL